MGRRSPSAALGSGWREPLVVTGSIFGLIALAHLARTIMESQRLDSDPWFYLEGPGLGIVAAALTLWAWRLFWRAARA